MKYPVPFGRHLLLERINVGGMAEVFKAKSFGVEGFERIVAVKRILPTMAEDDEFVTMFVDEARIASHLTHQNIVQIYELGRFEEVYYISMEYVAGRDLRQILDHHKRIKKPMEVAKACFVTSRVCEALEYAHRKKDPAGKELKIIHRDVSPQNVIISFEGEVKLCDFGIAKAASRASRTQVGVLKGKFAYMSPEQVRGLMTDRRSDLFALGVIFYEMLTGERLFLGESDYSTLEAVRNARVPAPTQYNAKIPPGLEKIMLRLLARDPKDRYQWAAEVHEDLLDHLVQDGKIYHGRHLRNWMQESYAREIEIENAKLEDFMRLERPKDLDAKRAVEPPGPPAAVLELAAGAVRDRASSPGADALAPEDTEEDAGDDTAHFPVAVAPHDLEPKRPEELITSTTSNRELEQLRRDLDQSTMNASPVPELASPSPVSSLFGAPELDAERSLGDGEDSMVRPASPRVASDASPPPPSLPELASEQVDDTFIPPQALDALDPGAPAEAGLAEAGYLLDGAGEQERTQWDAKAREVSDANETVFDHGDAADPNDGEAIGDTLTGDSSLAAEIRATQSELIDRLDADGVLDGGETVDAGEDSEEHVSPFVFDPSEVSLTSPSKAIGGGARDPRPPPEAPSIRGRSAEERPPARGSLRPSPAGEAPAPPAPGPRGRIRASVAPAPIERRPGRANRSVAGAAKVALTDPGAMEDKTSVNEAVAAPPGEDAFAPTTPSPVAGHPLGFDFDDGTLEAAEDPSASGPGSRRPESPARTPPLPERSGEAAARGARGKKGRPVSLPPPGATDATPGLRGLSGGSGRGSELEKPGLSSTPSRPPFSIAGRRRIWEIRGEERQDDPLDPGLGEGGPSQIFTPPDDSPRSLEGAEGPRGRGQGSELDSLGGGAREVPLEAPIAAPIGVDAPLGNPRLLMWVAGGIGLLALGLLIALLAVRAPTGASLHIVTEPTRAVEVRIDGKLVGTETPVEATALGLGLHTVELRAAGFNPYTQVVQISEAKPHTMVVPLERSDGAPPTTRPERPAEPAPKGIEKGSLSGSKTISELPDGDAPAERGVDSAPASARGVEPLGEAPPVVPAKRAAEKPAEDGAKAPILPVKAPILPAKAPILPAKAAEGSRPEGSRPAPSPERVAPAVEKERAPTPAEGSGAVAAGASAEATPAGNEAFLVIATKPPGLAVIIDGKPTNLRTPVRHPLAIAPGKHVVTFEMADGTTYSFEVQVAAGETKKLVKQLR